LEKPNSQSGEKKNDHETKKEPLRGGKSLDCLELSPSYQPEKNERKGAPWESEIKVGWIWRASDQKNGRCLFFMD